MPLGLPNVTTDFHGRARPTTGRRDAGAIQAGAAGAVKPGVPAPVPSAFAGRAPFTGIGPVPVYDKWVGVLRYCDTAGVGADAVWGLSQHHSKHLPCPANPILFGPS